jgi:carbamoyltransferase
MNILGISCFYHDAAAALVRDGSLIAAVHEERFSRRKHDPDFPLQAIRYCLQQGSIDARDIDYIVFYDKPFLKFERLLTTYLQTWPFSLRSFLTAMPVWLKEKLWIPQIIRRELDYDGEILFTEHHLSHAASAFLVSPFDEAAILTIDGVGEWETTTAGYGRGTDITMMHSIHFPHSLGLLYSAFTYYLGFTVNSAEYKVMGLAPYGEPACYDLIVNELVDIRPDGSFRLNMDYFTYHHGLRMTGKKFEKLFGKPRREPESGLLQFHKDVAASIQKVTEEIVVRMANTLHAETGMADLCMAGGVALNCVANSVLLERTPFRDIFIQPAAGDAGGAVGAALYVHNVVLGNKRTYTWKNAFLGPEYPDTEIETLLRSHGIVYTKADRDTLLSETARLIAEQHVVGWFQGRMEYGPRALGSRSILADARNKENWQRVNLKIKFRESFRPFAPTVLEERAAEYFSLRRASPYMLFTARVTNRVIPAVTHVDGSARIQTIRRDDHPLYYDLLERFDALTGCPVIVNTSFNVRGEPIVCTPADAVNCFLTTEMDYLVIGSFIVSKSAQRDGITNFRKHSAVTMD